MLPPVTPHPSPEQLAAFALGRVSDAELTGMARHLADCPECCSRLDHVGEPDPLLSGLRCAADGVYADDRSDAVRALRGGLLRGNPSAVVGPDATTPRPGGTLDWPGGSTPGQVGEYDVSAEVGRGGMGVVYQARHRVLNRPAAVKMILAGRFASDTDRLRFRLEAELAARILHPNVVQVYEVGEYDGCPFLAMEWVGGGTLAGYLDGRPWPPADAARLVRTLAGAVQAAHDQGVVHQNLKPANILLSGVRSQEPGGNNARTPSGTSAPDSRLLPKVADFGLARSLHGPGLTRSGQVAGTPEYMAPEQAHGAGIVGPAADVYALGGILYRLLTGRVPFSNMTTVEVLAAVAFREPPRPRRLNRSVPPDLEAVCLKCLEKPPHRRYETVQALADDLSRFLDRKPVTARRVGLPARLVRWGRRNPGTAALLVALGVVFAVGFGLVAWKWLEADRRRIEADGLRRAADDRRGEAEDSAAAADASRREARRNLYVANLRLAKPAIDAGELSLARSLLDEAAAGRPGDENLRGFEWHYLHRLAHPADRVVVRHAAGVTSAAFSRDGRLVAALCQDKILRVTDAGRDVFAVEIGRQGDVVAVTPDGGRVAAPVGQVVHVWDTRTWTATRLEVGNVLPRGVAFSPDGRRLAVATLSEGVQVWDVESGVRLATFRPDGVPVWGLVFSPDGRRLAVAGGDLLVRVCGSDDGRVLAKSAPFPWSSGPVVMAYRSDGREIAVTAEAPAVRLLDADTAAVRQTLPAASRGGPNDLAYTPGGRELAVVGLDGIVRVWEAATGRLALALRGMQTRSVFGVAVTADGRVLTASSDGTVVEWDPAASAESVVLGQFRRDVAAVAWSSDGRRVATGGDGGTVRVLAVDGSGTPVTIGAHTFETRQLAFSPDGRRLATAGFDPFARIWDAATGRPIAELKGHSEPLSGVAFSPDGRWVATAGEDGTARLWDAATGRPGRVLPAGGLLVSCVAFCAGGRSLAAGNDDGSVRVWDVASDGLPRVLSVGCGPVTAVAYRPPGGQLAVAGVDGAEVWDADAGRHRLVLRGHTGLVGQVVYSPDGRRIATAALDGTVRLWDAADGRELLRLGGIRATGLAFSTDGRRLAVGDGGAVRVYEADPLPADVLVRRRLTQ